MARIIIKRKSAVVGSLKNFDVYYKNTYIGELLNGGTVQFEVGVGTHILFFQDKLKAAGANADTSFQAVVNQETEVVVLQAKIDHNGNLAISYADNRPHYPEYNSEQKTDTVSNVIVTSTDSMEGQRPAPQFTSETQADSGAGSQRTAQPEQDTQLGLQKKKKKKGCITAVIIVVVLQIIGICILGAVTGSDDADTPSTSQGEVKNEGETTNKNVDHEHKWEKSTCKKPQICSICGEKKGKALGHTTDCGVCSRCKKEIRKKSPVTILNWTYKMDFVGGVTWTYKIKNNTDKEIKYVTMEWDCYNAVGDLIYDNIVSWQSSLRTKFTGPLAAHATSASEQVGTFYNSDFKKAKMSEIIVEYMDGTEERIGQYHDNVIG